MWTEELITDWKECRDDCELFKERHAKTSSYIAARFVHLLVYHKYKAGIVLAGRQTRETIHQEMIQIINSLPYPNAVDLIKRKNRNVIDTEHNHTYFGGANPLALRGRSASLAYFDGDESLLRQHIVWAKPTDLPNLYDISWPK